MTQPPNLQALIDDLIVNKYLSSLTGKQITQTLTTDTIKPSNPWFITLLIAIGAWLSLIPFLAFFGIFLGSWFSKHPDNIWVLGVLMITATTVIRHVQIESVIFFEQLLLALNLVGQTLFIAGIAMQWQILPTTIIVVILEIILFSSYRDNIIRFFATLIATAAIVTLLDRFGAHTGIHLLIVLLAIGAATGWFYESYCLTHPWLTSRYQAFGYGTVISLFSLLIPSILNENPQLPHLTWWVSTMGLTALLIIVQYVIAQQHRINSAITISIYGSTLLIGALAYQNPGILAALIVLLLGFQRSNRILVGLALSFLILFLVAYYYYLGTTLLDKSISLMATGSVFLGLRWFLKQFNQENANA
jgi:uncharacterized membrane protein